MPAAGFEGSWQSPTNNAIQFFSVDGALPNAQFQIAFDDIIWDSGAANLNVQAPPQRIAASPLNGTATQSGSGQLVPATTTSGEVDLHYAVNGGETRSLRMPRQGHGSSYTVAGLKQGDLVEYRFTAQESAGKPAVDSALRSHRMR